jgi:hypothetical protein
MVFEILERAGFLVRTEIRNDLFVFFPEAIERFAGKVLPVKTDRTIWCFGILLHHRSKPRHSG